MKKLLSVFLAVLMIFSVFSVSSSAATTVTAPDLQEAIDATKALYGENSMYNASTNKKGYVIVCYTVGVGTYMYEVNVYDTQKKDFVKTTAPGAAYYQVPTNRNENYIGYANYQLPYVMDTEEKQFVGWTCSGNQKQYTAGAVIQLTSDMITPGAECIYFNAEYITVVPQSDVLETIINVLIKVFGSIIGFLFFEGDPDQGAGFMEDMIGGILSGI